MIIGLCGKANAGKDTAADYLMSEHGFKRIAFALKLKQFCSFVFGLTPEQMSIFELKETPLPAEHVLPFSTSRQMCQRAVTAWADVLDMSFDEWSPIGQRHRVPLGRYPFQSPEQIIMALNTQLTMVLENKAGDRELAFFVLSLSPRQILQWVGTEVARAVYQDIWVEAAMHKITKWAAEGSDVVITDVRFQSEAGALNKAGATLTRVVRENVETTKEAGHSSEADLDRLPYKFVLQNYPATDPQSLQKYWKNIDALMATVQAVAVPPSPRPADPSELSSPTP